MGLNLRRRLSLLLTVALVMAMLTGCSSEQVMTVNADGSGHYEQTITMSTQEWTALESSLGLAELGMSLEEMLNSGAAAQSGIEMSVKDAEVNGVASKQMIQKIDYSSPEEFATKLMGMVSIQFNENYFTMNTMYTPGSSEADATAAMGDLTEMLGENAAELMAMMANATSSVRMTFPYPVLETNGTKQEDGKTVVWADDQALEMRMYATFTDAESKAAPTYTGVANGKSYNSAVTVTVNSEVLLKSVTVNGEETVSDTLALGDEGKYTITAVDNSGKSSKITFTIDMTKPTISGVKDGKTYKSARTIKFSDKGSGIKKATLNGKTIKTGKKVSKKGKYTLKVTDKAGNAKTVTFKIAA